MKNKSAQNNGKASKNKNGNGAGKRKKRAARRDSWYETISIPRSATAFEMLQDGKQVNCSTVAKALDVSRKVAQGVINTMRDKMKLPMLYDSKKHSYYFYEPVDHFPGLPLTEQELFTICVLNPAREMYKGTQFGKTVEASFRKILGRLDNEQKMMLEDLDTEFSFRPFGPEEIDIDLVVTLRRAVHDRRQVKFEHIKPEDDDYKWRHGDPYHVMLCDGAWYLFTYDHEAKDIRRFRISRIRNVKVLKEKFVFPKDFSVKKLLAKCFGIKSGNENHKVVVELTKWMTRIIGDRHLNAMAKRELLPEGGSRLTFELDSLDEIERWVLYWGEHVTVRENEALKQRLCNTAIKVLAKYGINVPNPQPAFQSAVAAVPATI